MSPADEPSRLLASQRRQDWRIKEGRYDPETTHAPDVEREVQRLQTLKTFQLLDAEQEECYDRFATLATRVFSVPLAIINLVDLGRTWLVGSSGFPADHPQEGDRLSSFCAHTILQRSPTLVVSDASTDFRFLDSPFVALGIRFFAGVALTSPEGARIGTLTIMDREPRTSFGKEDEQKLMDIAANVMALMVANRAVAHLKAMEKEEQNKMAMDWRKSDQTGDSYPHDVQRSATQIKQQLSTLRDDGDFQMVASDNHRSLVQSAWDNADFLYSSLVQQQSTDNSSPPLQDPGKSVEISSDRNNPQIPPSAQCPVPEKKLGEAGQVNVLSFVHDLESAMDAFPKKVSISFTVDRHVPASVSFPSLKVFRSAIALLASACERTEEGFIAMQVYCRKRAKQDDSNGEDELVFESVDTGPDVTLDKYSSLFMAPKEETDFVWDYECLQNAIGKGDQKTRPIPSNGFAVYPVAQFMESINGDYGFRPRVPKDHVSQPADTGSIFWFSVPLRSDPRAADAAYRPTTPTTPSRLQQRIVQQLYRPSGS